MVEADDSTDQVRRYTVRGHVFFVSADLFAAAFEYHGQPERVVIDMREAHLWDITAVAAVDKVVFRYRRRGVKVEVHGMNAAAQPLVARTGKHDKAHLPEGAAH